MVSFRFQLSFPRIKSLTHVLNINLREPQSLYVRGVGVTVCSEPNFDTHCC